MTNDPTKSARPSQSPRPSVRTADVPSETFAQGLPDVGEGASAVHLARDVPLGLQAGEDAEVDPSDVKD